MTRRELYKEMRRLAEPIYGAREATQIARIIAEERLGWSRMDLILSPEEGCGISDEQAQQILDQIAEARPVQYIVGEAEFCDFRVVVREGALIPRPESEELVRWIVSDNKQSSGRILDIGTGSGALAIALARALPDCSVEALDISSEAIAIASENVARLAPKVKIIEGDALHGVEHYVDGAYDIILSNPPYIPQGEQQQMRSNVVDHEPHLALFVPDDDPLIFYRTIARSAQEILTPQGRLYFEIHENYADDMLVMLRQQGYAEVELRYDINDKARMICAQRE